MATDTISSLKELMNRRFDELEKRMSDKKEYDEANIEILHKKDAEQDVRLNDHAERIRELERLTVVPPKTPWDKLKDAFIQWLVPFVMIAIIYYIANGGGR